MRHLFATLFAAAVCGSFGPTLAADPYDFGYDNALLGWIKLDPKFDYPSHADSFLKLFRPAVWERVKDNEFELERERTETIKQVKERVAEFSLERGFILRPKLQLGKYDLKANAFPIENMSETHFWYQAKYVDGHLPNRICVYFRNHHLLAGLPMPAGEAEQFLKSRPTRYGRIDREVPATIHFVLVRRRDDDNQLLAEIRSAAIFDDAQRRKQLWEAKAPAPEENGTKVKK